MANEAAPGTTDGTVAGLRGDTAGTVGFSPGSSFTAGGLGATTSIYQLLFVDNVGGNNNGTFFIDNVYFWK